MMEYLFIYLLQMADSLHNLECFIYILLTISIFAWIYSYMVFDTTSDYNGKKLMESQGVVRSIKRRIKRV